MEVEEIVLVKATAGRYNNRLLDAGRAENGPLLPVERLTIVLSTETASRHRSGKQRFEPLFPRLLFPVIAGHRMS